jgi:NAD(P) transhydrogenase subunit beta
MELDAKDLALGLYIFILAGFLGFYVIARVPPLLHTPLMSATNAISGVSLIGSMVIAGASYDALSTILGFVAVTCSATNVFGGFLITDRMLKMFKPTHQPGQGARRSPGMVTVLLAAGVSCGLLALAFALAKLGTVDERLVLDYLYILSAVFFILGLRGLSSPKWARQGMLLAELGMFVAVVGTLLHPDIKESGYVWIGVGLLIGAVVGGSMGLQIPMTAVPQRTALSHSLGALAAALVGISEYTRHHDYLTSLQMTPLGFEVIIGFLTFTGSLMAAAKLQDLLPSAPITYKGQNVSNLTLLAVLAVCFILLIVEPTLSPLFYVVVVLSLLFGFLLVIPIGAADMPVVIALLNSYGGLAGAAMGFVLVNKIQIITGSLDGTSGFMLSLLMCRAMNRSALNVLFGAFGKVEADQGGAAAEAKGTVRSIAADELAVMLDSARSVIIVPGYGMAVAQAQYGLSDLAKLLAQRGVDVKYAIHPVAGRMPGHMNVLLAEASVPYDQLYEMEQINPYFAEADIALVVGANDVTNPAAKHDKSSPLYGMPILEVERAKSIIVLKRSMRPGFAGVDNELYYNPKCMMLFGDAKESVTSLFAAKREACLFPRTDRRLGIGGQVTQRILNARQVMLQDGGVVINVLVVPQRAVERVPLAVGAQPANGVEIIRPLAPRHVHPHVVECEEHPAVGRQGGVRTKLVDLVDNIEPLAVEDLVQRVIGRQVLDRHLVARAPGMLDEASPHHLVVFVPVVIGVGGRVDADEAAAAFDEIDQAFLQLGLAFENRLLFLGVFGHFSIRRPEDIERGIQHDDRIELLELFGLEVGFILGVDGRVSAGLLSEQGQRGGAGRNGIVTKAIGLAKDQHLVRCLRLGRRLGRQGLRHFFEQDRGDVLEACLVGLDYAGGQRGDTQGKQRFPRHDGTSR